MNQAIKPHQTEVCVQKKGCIISGLFKFDLKMSEDETVEHLIRVASKWALGDRRWQRLYVRKCSKTQYGIGFEYLLETDENEKARKDFFYKMTDQLRRQFGNDFVGWDMANPTWFIKLK